ncbi:MAG TPA: ABC transporter ATP-binding protein [Thermoplasmata archaeon]|nr:ABC transporter ATP-binding protein [Thermoplasmata archaeon]
MTDPVLDIEHLEITYTVGAGTFRAVSDVSLKIYPRQVIGIVGETGCGKSTLAQAIPRLLPEPPASIGSGQIVFRGTDLVKVPKRKLPMVRGTGIAMIFQEPLNSLNPAFRVFDQIAESIRIRHYREMGWVKSFTGGDPPFDYSKPPVASSVGGALVRSVVPDGALEEAARDRLRNRSEFREEVLRYLRLVRINDPETILNLYPHELSGGMRQRIMIAMALSEKPSLLIADEPTSALDVTIQAQVLTLMKELIDEVDAAILFISHDLGVIAETADEVGVMYAGRMVEYGPVAEVFRSPRHPYTKALLRAAPAHYKADGPLSTIAGSVPNLSRPPPGCRFHPRCVLAQDVCRGDPPPLAPVDGASAEDGRGVHRSACYFSDKVPGLP